MNEDGEHANLIDWQDRRYQNLIVRLWRGSNAASRGFAAQKIFSIGRCRCSTEKNQTAEKSSRSALRIINFQNLVISEVIGWAIGKHNSNETKMSTGADARNARQMARVPCAQRRRPRSVSDCEHAASTHAGGSVSKLSCCASRLAATQPLRY